MAKLRDLQPLRLLATKLRSMRFEDEDVSMDDVLLLQILPGS